MAAERPKWAMRLSEHPQSGEHEHPIKTVLSTISCQMPAKSRTLTFSNDIRKETWCLISSLRAVSICSVQKPINPNEQRCFLENTSTAPRCTVTTALMSLLWGKNLKCACVCMCVCVYVCTPLQVLQQKLFPHRSRLKESFCRNMSHMYSCYMSTH